MNQKCNLKFLAALPFLLIFIYIIVVFFISQMVEASNKPFWGDERAGLSVSVYPSSYTDMIIKGARLQASAPPLDYIAIKILDDLKKGGLSVRLKDEVYFRLWANGITVLSMIIVLMIFLYHVMRTETKWYWISIRSMLLVLAIFAVLYSRYVYYYAAEMRPYALWNAMWFFVLAAGFFYKENDKYLRVAAVLLAFSVSAAIFQIICLALAIGIYELLEKSEWKVIAKQLIKLLLVPFAIVFYYCLHAGTWEMVSAGGSAESFWGFWRHKSIIVPKMLIVIFLCYFKKDSRRYMISPLSVLILYLIGPAIFYFTRLKGYFYDERQYIYHDLTNGVFVLTVIQCLPVYVQSITKRSQQLLLGAILCIICLNVVLRPKFINKFNKAKSNTESYYRNLNIINIKHNTNI